MCSLKSLLPFALALAAAVAVATAPATAHAVTIHLKATASATSIADTTEFEEPVISEVPSGAATADQQTTYSRASTFTAFGVNRAFVEVALAYVKVDFSQTGFLSGFELPLGAVLTSDSGTTYPNFAALVPVPEPAGIALALAGAGVAAAVRTLRRVSRR